MVVRVLVIFLQSENVYTLLSDKSFCASPTFPQPAHSPAYAPTLIALRFTESFWWLQKDSHCLIGLWQDLAKQNINSEMGGNYFLILKMWLARQSTSTDKEV